MTTKQEAKEITIEIFTYLAKHPEIKRKEDLPVRLYRKIKNSLSQCRLCELNYDDCLPCPLDTGDMVCIYYENWVYAKTPAERTAAANKIVDLVKAWEV